MKRRRNGRRRRGTGVESGALTPLRHKTGEIANIWLRSSHRRRGANNSYLSCRVCTVHTLGIYGNYCLCRVCANYYYCYLLRNMMKYPLLFYSKHNSVQHFSVINCMRPLRQLFDCYHHRRPLPRQSAHTHTQWSNRKLARPTFAKCKMHRIANGPRSTGAHKMPINSAKTHNIFAKLDSRNV